jgi:hypothetical protein
MKNPSLYLERAAFHLNLHLYCSIWPTYRNHTARRSKPRVYAEVVCRKCGERVTEERQPHLDTSTTPVCPLFLPYAHLPVDVPVYRGVSPTTQIRAEVRMKIGHSVWTKYREANEVIELDGLFDDYWSSNNHEFTVLSQSSLPNSPRISSDREGQRLLSLGSIVAV